MYTLGSYSKVLAVGKRGMYDYRHTDFELDCADVGSAWMVATLVLALLPIVIAPM
jgi:hypothetical protein